MKNTAQLTDAELRAYSGEHVLYELQMLFCTGMELGKPELSGWYRSVLVESFAIHLRNLIEFFFTTPTHGDDVAAMHFCPTWNENLSAKLRTAKERANKEVGHLTLGRKSDHDSGKLWVISTLLAELYEVAKRFSAKADQSKLSPKISEWLSGFPTGVAVIADGSTSTTFSYVRPMGMVSSSGSLKR